MTSCPCGEQARPNQRNCLDCHSASMRKHRKLHPLTPEQRQKDNCRSYALVYLKRGKIQREPCKVCGEKAEMHHEDYSQPLLIDWLCRKHHLEYQVHYQI